MICAEDRRRAAERLLEDESLTADMVDAAAKLLLDWGLAQAERVAQQSEGLPQEELDARLAVLRREMKRINKQVGEALPEAQADRVRDLLAETQPEQNAEMETERFPEDDAACNPEAQDET